MGDIHTAFIMYIIIIVWNAYGKNRHKLASVLPVVSNILGMDIEIKGTSEDPPYKVTVRDKEGRTH